MRNLSLSIISMFLFLTSYGQGSVAGKVIDSKTKEAVIGANVVIQGTTTGAATDVDGNFLMPSVNEGTYAIQISSVTYKTHVIQNVVVEIAKRVTLNIELHEDVSELQEVVVQAERRTDTDFDLVKSIKDAKVVVVGVTSEQIAKTLDRDAAQVLRRVPGITIRQDQFVQIRGLSERYNPVMLHNAYAPSVETDIRSFSFATLPSNQIDRMLVFKSPAADLPGDFAGGVVKVFTKSIPEENGLVIDYSTQYRAGTTFQDYLHQQKDPNHFTGFNNGYYDLPAGLPSNLGNSSLTDAQLTNAAESFKNLWVEQKSMAIPDQRLNITYGKKFNIGRVQVGNISALTYSNAYSIFKNIERGDFQTTTGGGATATSTFRDDQYNQQIRTGFLFNWAFKFNPDHTIELKNLYNQSSNDQFVHREGLDGPYIVGGGFDKVYRGIYSGQLMGTHNFFGKKTSVEWVAGYNNANRDQPDFKRYRYVQLDGPDQLIISNNPNPTYLGRFFSKMDESANSFGLNVRQQISLREDATLNPEIKVGLFYEYKSRNFHARNIGYIGGTDALTSYNVSFLPINEVFQPANYGTGIRISEDTKRKDSYSASNRLLAYYIMGSIPFSKKVRLDLGVRIEDNVQKLDSYDDLKSQNVNVNNPITRMLPSLNFSYNFNEKMLIRAAYGQTLNRPEFRELAPFSFYDYNLNFVFKGNPNIKTAEIHNVDLRWEFYPSKGELITFGAFYKNFINPIETIVDPNFGGVREATFDNPESATAYGIEIEVKKSLASFGTGKFFKRTSVMFNTTLIDSKVHLRPDQQSAQEVNRPLQGQAPYVFNSGIFYNDEEHGWTVNLLHNIVGKNIFIAGVANYADVFNMPRHVVDLVFTKRITDRIQLKGGVSDILNQPIRILSDGDRGIVTFDAGNTGNVQLYRPGQVFSIGFSWKVL